MSKTQNYDPENFDPEKVYMCWYLHKPKTIELFQQGLSSREICKQITGSLTKLHAIRRLIKQCLESGEIKLPLPITRYGTELFNKMLSEAGLSKIYRARKHFDGFYVIAEIATFKTIYRLGKERYASYCNLVKYLEEQGGH